MNTVSGGGLRRDLSQGEIVSFIGVYDLFSASIAARYFKGLFVSGFSFAASHYGLPDIGFITWTDIVAFAQRLRTVLPDSRMLVDIDDGFGDTEIACHVVSVLERAGVSGVIIEDQKRPRRCGHFDGKQLMELDEFLIKLEKVLSTRRDLFVIARTDAVENEEIERRVEAFAGLGADAVLVDAVRDLDVVKRLGARAGVPVVYNQIAGGKSPICGLDELKEAGVSMVVYSTPCLFAAQGAIEDAMKMLKERNGRLSEGGPVNIKECTALLNENLVRRDTILKTE